MKVKLCGTYESCSKCKLKPNCCCDFGKIDAPVISKKEKAMLSKLSSVDDFCAPCRNGIYSLKLIDEKCIFYDGGCTIYDYRPLDCRLFPFDLKKIDNKYYLVLYELECIDDDMLLKYVHDVDVIVDEIKPWIDRYVDENITVKLDKMRYTIVKEIDY